MAVNLNDQVDIFLRAGVTQFEVEPVELHRDVGQVVDPDDLVAHRAGKPAEALAFGEDAPRDVQRFDLFLHLDDVDGHRVLFVGECQFGGFVEQFRTLPVQSLVEEDTCEIDLFAQLHRHRALHVEQPDAHQYLFVKMRLHVGQLLLFDRAALQDALFVVFVQ